jgi:hypothetical protein
VSASSVSVPTSRAIYDDAVRAHDDFTHPCHRFVGLQHNVPPERWQMPIPFMGATAAKRLVFIGLNPSYDPNENTPRWGISFEEWDQFWRAAFNPPSATWPRLYQWYQRIGQRAFGDDFRLGEDALVLEVIRYRSEKSEGCDDADVLGHEMPVMMRLLNDIRPTVIFCSGSKVLWRMREKLPGLAVVLSTDYRIKEVEGRLWRCEAPWGRTTFIGARHLTGGFGWSNESRFGLGDAIRAAVT